jgi:hypothetical protein
MFLLFMRDIIQSNSHTMVHTNTFVVDLIYIQSIKQRTDSLLSMGCMRCLYICLYAQFEILQTATCLRVVHALSRSQVSVSLVLPRLHPFDQAILPIVLVPCSGLISSLLVFF